jgi:hypothetical protein
MGPGTKSVRNPGRGQCMNKARDTFPAPRAVGVGVRGCVQNRDQNRALCRAL